MVVPRDGQTAGATADPWDLLAARWADEWAGEWAGEMADLWAARSELLWAAQ